MPIIALPSGLRCPYCNSTMVTPQAQVTKGNLPAVRFTCQTCNNYIVIKFSVLEKYGLDPSSMVGLL